MFSLEPIQRVIAVVGCSSRGACLIRLRGLPGQYVAVAIIGVSNGASGIAAGIRSGTGRDLDLGVGRTQEAGEEIVRKCTCSPVRRTGIATLLLDLHQVVERVVGVVGFVVPAAGIFK